MSTTRSISAAALFYFSIFGALGALVPFLPFVLGDAGLSPTEVGVALAVMPICDILVPPLWGGVGDLMRARTRLLRLAAIGAAASILVLAVVEGFFPVVAGLLLFCAFRAPLVPLGDTMARSLLSDPTRFGHLRLVGSFGFGVAALSVGALGAATLPIVAMAASGYALAAMAAFHLPPTPPIVGRPVAARDVAQLMRPTYLLFLFGTCLHYVGHSTYDAFIGLHFEALGYSRAWVGTAWAVGVGAEIFVLWQAPRLLRRFSAVALLWPCAAVAGGRWLLLMTLEDGWAILLSQPLHALSFGLWYVSLVDFAQRETDERIRGTAQALVIAAMGIGRVVGYGVGGRAFEVNGGEGLFGFAAVAAVLATGVYGALLSTVRSHRRLAAGR